MITCLRNAARVINVGIAYKVFFQYCHNFKQLLNYAVTKQGPVSLFKLDGAMCIHRQMLDQAVYFNYLLLPVLMVTIENALFMFNLPVLFLRSIWICQLFNFFTKLKTGRILNV